MLVDFSILSGMNRTSFYKNLDIFNASILILSSFYSHFNIRLVFVNRLVNI